MRNKLLAIIHDFLSVPLCWLLAHWLRFNLDIIPDQSLSLAYALLLYILPLQCAAFIVFGLYRGIWRFASIPDLLRIIKAVLFGCALIMAFIYFSHKMHQVPRSIIPIYGVLLILFLGGSRLIVRCFKDYKYFLKKGKRVLIIGAGKAGEGLVRDLLRDVNKQLYPVAFIDDKIARHGQEIHGIRVLGTCNDIVTIVEKYNIELIIIAMPSANSEQMRNIVAICEETKLPVRTLPSIKDLGDGKVNIDLLRDVSVEDLLGRDQVNIDWQAIAKDLTGNTVLVTGGGGSIGAELCRQIAALNPKELLIVDKSEFNVFNITEELKHLLPSTKILGFVVDVIDNIAMEQIIAQHKPSVILHAAAYKHVPLLEAQIRIAMQNNILGLECVAKLAVKYNVNKFIFVSTDKAVNPSNIMGATKRAGEVLCHYFNELGETRFIIVRFGNVLGSAGSVVPIFKKQLAKGGPLTVTHPEITRFFMTIPEACQLILQACTLGNGGETFVLDMGKPVKIKFLAEQIILLSGKSLAEVEIKYTGLRAGEKLYEELFYEHEHLSGTGHEKIMQTEVKDVNSKLVSKVAVNIQKAVANNDLQALHRDLRLLVPAFQV